MYVCEHKQQLSPLLAVCCCYIYIRYVLNDCLRRFI